MNLDSTPYDLEDGLQGYSGPFCPQCGAELEWVDCDACGGEGDFDAYDDDPMWYSPGDTEDCQQCSGDGGWWFCPNENCERAMIPPGREFRP